VQEITQAAQQYEYDPAIPLRYWLRSAQAMLKEVRHQSILEVMMYR
jgi:STAM-binding protein